MSHIPTSATANQARQRLRMFPLLPALAILTCASMANASEGSFIIQITVPISPRGTGWEVDFEQMQVPVAVPGAMPEDVLKALAMPIKLPSLIASYHVENANVISLCGIGLSGSFALEHYRINLDLTKFSTKPLGLTEDHVIEASIESVMRSLRNLTSNAKPIEVEFRITASPDDLKKFQRLERKIILEAKK